MKASSLLTTKGFAQHNLHTDNDQDLECYRPCEAMIGDSIYQRILNLAGRLTILDWQDHELRSTRCPHIYLFGTSEAQILDLYLHSVQEERVQSAINLIHDSSLYCQHAGCGDENGGFSGGCLCYIRPG